MPIQDLARDLLPRLPTLLALAVVIALPLVAAVLLAPRARRTVPAVLAASGFLAGSIAVLITPGLRGPVPADPAALATQHGVVVGAGAVFVGGVVCLLIAVVLILIRQERTRSRGAAAMAAGLLIGLGSPLAARLSLQRIMGIAEFHGGAVAPMAATLLLAAAGAALLVAAGIRSSAAAVGIVAGAVPAAVLAATACAMSLVAATTDAELLLLPAPLILVASAVVGALGVAVWRMAGHYWTAPGTANPAGARRDSSSRST